jgi:hypothetical protein
MKTFIVLLLLTSSLAWSQTYVREVTFYNEESTSKGIPGKILRRESIYEIQADGFKVRVPSASRTYDNSSNNLLFEESFRGTTKLSAADNVFPKSGIRKHNARIKEDVDKSFELATGPAKVRKSFDDSLDDCTIDPYYTRISCPHGSYVKESSIADELRKVVEKEQSGANSDKKLINEGKGKVKAQ